MGGVLLSWLKSARLPGRRAATLLPNFNNRRDIPSHPIADYAGTVWALLASKTVADTVATIAGRFEGLSQDFGRGATDIFYRDPPFFYLKAVAERFGDDFRGFLDTLARASASANKQKGEKRAADAGEERVYRKIELATALRAKGKEFHTVAILNANAGVWPSTKAETDAELEAERRLFYVAMTRAQKKLVVSWCRVDSEGKPAARSPYIGEAGLVGERPNQGHAGALPLSESSSRVPNERGERPNGGGASVRSLPERPARDQPASDGVRTRTRVLKKPPLVLRPGEPAVIDAPDLAKVVGLGESGNREFKSTLRCNLHTGKSDKKMELAVLKTLAAFLNTDGGTLIIGVDDDGGALGLDADGFPSEDKMGQHLVNIVKARMRASAMTNVKLYFDSYDGNRVLVASCRRSRNPVWVKDGKKEMFFIRTGATTTELKPSETQDYVASRRRFLSQRR